MLQLGSDIMNIKILIRFYKCFLVAHRLTLAVIGAVIGGVGRVAGGIGLRETAVPVFKSLFFCI